MGKFLFSDSRSGGIMPGPNELIDSLVRALLSIDRLEVKTVLNRAGTVLKQAQLIEDLVVPAMEKIGDEWSAGNVSLSQVYMSSRICEEFAGPAGLPASGPRKGQPKTACAVLEDHHSLGKKIVCAFLRAAGFEILDYGQGLSVDELVKKTIKDNIAVLMISTLMLPSALKVIKVRQRLDEEKYKVKVVVGGAPFLFDRELWKDVGADAMGKSASEAIEIIETMAEGRA